MSGSRVEFIKSNYGGTVIKRFVIKVIITFLVLIITAVTCAYFLLFIPTQNQITEKFIENYDDNAQLRYRLFKDKLYSSIRSAEALINEDRMGAILAYKDGEMSLDELNEYVQQQYLTYIYDFDYLLQAESYIDGQFIGSMTEKEYTYNFTTSEIKNMTNETTVDFCLENDDIYCELILPINLDEQVSGYNRLIFYFNDYFAILASPGVTSTIINNTTYDEITNDAEFIQTRGTSEIINKNEVFYHLTSINDKYYFVTSQKETELLNVVNDIKFRASFYGMTTLFLLTIGISPIVILHARKEFLGYENIYSDLSTELGQLKMDPLTNTKVRRACEEHLKNLHDNYVKSGISPAIIMFDIDDLKNINDSYGHAAGDEAIKGIVAAVSNKIRTNDCLCRWGGDEFILIISDLEKIYAGPFIEKILQAVLDSNIEYKGKAMNPTISVGLTYFNESDYSYIDTINRVDHAMYKSKITEKKGATIL